MTARRIIDRLVAILVIVGLLALPLATPAAAKMPPAATAMGGPVDMSASSGMAAMSGEMPCCPDQQKDHPCQDCPMVGMCIPAMVQSHPYALGISIFFPMAHSFFVRDDVIADGLLGPPPDHPPRTLI